jgi:hydrogenase maturation protease
MTTNQLEIRIIGIGNTFRSDDGVGIVVARELRFQIPTGVTILEESGEGVALMEAWQGAAAAILVDAVRSGAPPGTIHRLDALAEAIPNHLFHYSTHAFSVAQAIELARALNQLPRHLVVYGIEGKEFGAGTVLSANVEQASALAVGRILEEVRALKKVVEPASHSPL